MRDTNISPTTDVCQHVAEYSAKAFDCALGGPFNKLRSIGSQRPRLSVGARLVFISASTVSYLIFLIVRVLTRFVKWFLKN
jgi:hypothetical protein